MHSRTTRRTFSFTAGGRAWSPTSFSLDDDSDPALSLTPRRSNNVVPGSGYSVGEAVAGRLGSVVRRLQRTAARVANIDVSAGETVTCTFRQTCSRPSSRSSRTPSPTTRRTSPSRRGGGLSPSSFSLDDDSDPTLSNTHTFNSVAPGTYSVSEAATLRLGTSRARSCSDGSPISAIDLAAGEERHLHLHQQEPRQTS